MKLSTRKAAVRSVGAAAIGIGALVLAAGPAAAGTDDSFTVRTTGAHCGSAEYVDYGPGAPGGGNNDDYIVIHDFCPDGHGVTASVTWKDQYGTIASGSKTNNNSAAGAPVYWDPFHVFPGNVLGGDTITIKVCLTNGSACATATKTSSDG